MFYAIEKWTKGDQVVYLFSDYHLAPQKTSNKVSCTQRRELINLAYKLNAHVIVEDEIAIAHQTHLFSSAEFVQPTYKLNWRELMSNNQQGTPLLMLSHWLEIAGIQYTNSEFRYSPWRPLNTFFKLIDTIKAEILAYDDGEQLNAYYQEKLRDLENSVEIPCKQLFDELRTTGLTISQYAYQSANPTYYPELETVLKNLLSEAAWDISRFSERDKLWIIFIRYTIPLLDFRILHIIAHSSEKNIFVCVGGLHAQNITEGLIHLGFKHEKTVGQKLEFDRALNALVEPNAVHIAESMKQLNTANYSKRNFSIKRLWISALQWLLVRAEKKLIAS